AELKWHRQRDKRDERLQTGISVKCLPRRQAWGEPASEKGTACDPAHESRHDGARGRGCVTKVERQETRPGHLINEARHPRARKCDEEQPGHGELRYPEFRSGTIGNTRLAKSSNLQLSRTGILRGRIM